MTIITESGKWVIKTETRNKVIDGELVAVNVVVAWNEEKGYIREFYGSQTYYPEVDLT
jgi:hypothetical protein